MLDMFSPEADIRGEGDTVGPGGDVPIDARDSAPAWQGEIAVSNAVLIEKRPRNIPAIVQQLDGPVASIAAAEPRYPSVVTALTAGICCR